MKTHLNWVATAALAGFAMITTPAISQTQVKQEPTDAYTSWMVDEPANPGTLVLGAGGTRRVVARIGLDAPNMLRLQLSNLKEYRTSIVLTDANGAVRWEQQIIDENAFAKMIDLKALTLDPGAYSLRVQTGEAFLEQELVMKNRKATLGKLRYGAVASAGSPMAKN